MKIGERAAWVFWYAVLLFPCLVIFDLIDTDWQHVHWVDDVIVAAILALLYQLWTSSRFGRRLDAWADAKRRRGRQQALERRARRAARSRRP